MPEPIETLPLYVQELMPPPKTTSMVCVKITDQRINQTNRLFVGSFYDVWGGTHAIGRAHDNLIVLDSPEVPEVYGRLKGMSNHRFITFDISQSGLRIDSYPFDIPPFTLEFSEQTYEGNPLDPTKVQGFAAWVSQPVGVLKLPEQPAPSPAAEATASFLRGLSPNRWFHPDTEMDALSQGAKSWIRDRLDEHHAALGRPSPRAEDILLVRSYSWLIRHCYHEWSPITAYTEGNALAYFFAMTDLAMHSQNWRVKNVLRHAMGQGGEAPGHWSKVMPTSLRTSLSTLVSQIAERKYNELPCEALESLLSLYERGLVPVPLPNDRWCVYAPLWRGDTYVAEPGESFEAGPTPACTFEQVQPLIQDNTSLAKHFGLTTSMLIPL